MKASARALRTAPEAAERLLLAAAVSAVAADTPTGTTLPPIRSRAIARIPRSVTCVTRHGARLMAS